MSKRLGSVGDKQPGDEALGLRLLDWHSSGGSGIYAVGSTLFSRAVTLGNDAAAAHQVRRALDELAAEWRAADARRQACWDAGDEAGALAERAVADELDDLWIKLHMRASELLEAWPEDGD